MVSIESDGGGGGSEVIALVIILKGTVFESGRPAGRQPDNNNNTKNWPRQGRWDTRWGQGKIWTASR